MIKHHLGPSLSVWIMQVSRFSGVLINRFHCIAMLLVLKEFYELTSYLPTYLAIAILHKFVFTSI